MSRLSDDIAAAFSECNSLRTENAALRQQLEAVTRERNEERAAEAVAMRDSADNFAAREAAEARAEALQKDAERYRWLRDAASQKLLLFLRSRNRHDRAQGNSALQPRKDHQCPARPSLK